MQVEAAGYDAPIPQDTLGGRQALTGHPDLRLSAAELAAMGALAARARKLIDLKGKTHSF